MQLKVNFLLALAGLCLAGSSCTTDEITIPQSELYTREFIKQFGVFDPNNDWNHSQRINVTVTTSAPTDVRIYANVNGVRYLFGTFLGVNGSRELGVDIPKGIAEVIVNGGGVSLTARAGDNVSLSDVGSRSFIESSDAKVKTRSLANEKDKWMVIPWLNGTIFRRKMPENKYNADREGVTPDFMFRNDNPGDVTFIIRPLFWQTSRTHKLGIFYYDEQGRTVHVPVWEMEKVEEHSDDLLYEIANSDVKYVIVPEDEIKEYMAQHNVVRSRLSAEDNFSQSCSSADDRDMTLACREYLEKVLPELPDRTDGKKFNYVYRWKFLTKEDAEKDSKVSEDDIDKLLIVYTYFSYHDLKGPGRQNNPSGRYPTDGGDLPTSVIPEEHPNENNYYNSIVSKGIEVTIPSGLLYGFYIEDATDSSKRYYSTRTENFAPGWYPVGERGENDDYAEFEMRGQASYAATWVGTKYNWRYLAFEDWGANEQSFSSDMKDLNDLVFIIDEHEPFSTLVDLEHGDKLSVPYEWVVAAEDLGTTDDFDFNDVVFGVSNYKELEDGTATVDVRPLASGGTLPVYLCYTQKDRKRIRLNDGKEFHSWFKGDNPSSLAINVGGKKASGDAVAINVDPGFSMACCQQVVEPNDENDEKGNMGGFSVEVEKDGRVVEEIHAPNLDATAEYEAPQMICVPMDWCWPTERTHILNPYPKFQDWVTDQKSCPDWHDASNRQSGYYVRTDLPAVIPSVPSEDNPWGGDDTPGNNELTGEFVEELGWGTAYFYKISPELLESATRLLVHLEYEGATGKSYRDKDWTEYGIAQNTNKDNFVGDELAKVKKEGGFYIVYYNVTPDTFHVTIKIRIEY